MVVSKSCRCCLTSSHFGARNRSGWYPEVEWKYKNKVSKRGWRHQNWTQVQKSSAELLTNFIWLEPRHRGIINRNNVYNVLTTWQGNAANMDWLRDEGAWSNLVNTYPVFPCALVVPCPRSSHGKSANTIHSPHLLLVSRFSKYP